MLVAIWGQERAEWTMILNKARNTLITFLSLGGRNKLAAHSLSTLLLYKIMQPICCLPTIQPFSRCREAWDKISDILVATCSGFSIRSFKTVWCFVLFMHLLYIKKVCVWVRLTDPSQSKLSKTKTMSSKRLKSIIAQQCWAEMSFCTDVIYENNQF